MDNIYKAVQLTIDSQNLALSKKPTHVYIANQYVDTNDTPLITAPFIIQKALENGTGVVDIVSSTIGSIYEVRLLCDAEVLISGYFYMPPMNTKFSELELYTSYPPRTPPVINEFWQKTENFILEKTNTLLNFVQVFNSLSSMRLSLGCLEELLTTKKSNLVSAINEVVSVKANKADVYTKPEIDTNYGGVKTLYDKNVVAGAGANGWTTDLVVENGLTQKQINNKQRAKNLDTVNVLDYMTASELSAYQADATTFNAAPVFNRASVDCYNKKRKLLAYGTFYTTETIVITSDCDLSQADIFTSASLGIDVKDAVDTASVKRLIGYNFVYPRSLKYTQKPAVGWVANTVGLRITNAYSCKAYFGRITGFETNILICAKDTGNVYNEYFMGWCDNGKVNLLLTANDTGWTNENNFYGGRFSHQSGEGTNVAGTRHIKIKTCESGINNNVFYKPSIEGDVAEYHVECGGSYNNLLSCRWEAYPPKVLYVTDDNLSSAANLATYNLISGGYYVDKIVTTNVGTKSTFSNRLIGVSREINNISSSTGGHRFKNHSSNGNAVLTGFDAAADLANEDVSKYTWSLSSAGLSGKLATDTYPKITIDFINSKFLIGNGIVAPTIGITRLGSSGAWTGSDYVPATTATYSLGITSYRWKQMFLSEGFAAWGATPPSAKPSVTGSRGGNAALASLITALASYGLITDSTTA